MLDSVPWLEPLERFRLANGLSVLLGPRRQAETASVSLWYHVGSQQELAGQRGFAHLFEHLMFEGSRQFPDGFFRTLQPYGARINGSTSTDRTNYVVELPAEHLRLALRMEADRMGFLIPNLTEEALKIQQDVVQNEYRQNYVDRPYGRVGSMLAEALFPPEHPYHWLPIGRMEDVASASLAQVAAFHEKYYVPANACLCVMGDIEVDSVRSWIEEAFGALRGGGAAVRRRPRWDGLEQTRSLELFDRVELERCYLLWPSVSRFHSDEAALDVLVDLLGRGRGSRLYRRLVRDEELALDVAVSHPARELAGHIAIAVTVRPDRDVRRIVEILEDEIRDLQHRGPSAEELERVRNLFLTAELFALEVLGGFGGLADRLCGYQVMRGDPGAILEEQRKYWSVTAEEVMGVAERYLVDRPRLDLRVRPQRPATATPSTQVEPTATPTVRRSTRRDALPIPHEVVLDDGSTVWILQETQMPLCVATYVSRNGGPDDPIAMAGRSLLTADLLREGTMRRSAEQLALDAETLGLRLASSADWHGLSVGISCLDEHLVEGLEMIVEVWDQPAFEASEFERLRDRRLTSLQAERIRSESLAQRALLGCLYDSADPYSMPLRGSSTTLRELTGDKIRDFHRDHRRAAAGGWILVGPNEPEEMLDRLRAVLDRRDAKGGIGASSTSMTIETPIRDRDDQPRRVLVNRPGAEQAVVLMGHVGLARTDSDWEALTLASLILGGQFTSRLNQRVREELGLTYGIGCSLDPRRRPGPFAISASLDPDRLVEALREIQRIVGALVTDQPPTLVELERARQAVLEAQVRRYATRRGQADRFATLFSLGLDRETDRRQRIAWSELSVDQVASTARRVIDPDRLHVVVVGDRDRLDNQLSGLEGGTWDVLDPESLVDRQPHTPDSRPPQTPGIA